jgi:DNA helicase II / ATP-dependent DNA helicase PcrA
MYRTNAQSRMLKKPSCTAGLPYRLVGAQRFYGRREVKDVIAYLRLVHNPSDEISLTRAINTPARGIGDKTSRPCARGPCRQAFRRATCSWKWGGAASRLTGRRSAGGRGRRWSTFGRMLLRPGGMRPVEEAPLLVMDRILEDIDYHAYIDDGTDEGRERWENVMELRRLAANSASRGWTPSWSGWRWSPTRTRWTNANVPTLLTLHAAKGLEFPAVFIVGLDDGTLPHSRSFEEPEEMMEERRLMYVGITRAMDWLYLVYPLHRSTYGYAEPTDRSRFLDDLPEEMLDLQGTAVTTGRPRRGMKSDSPYRPDRWDSAPPAAAVKPVEQRYSPGSRVLHPVWGEGMVLNSRILDGDEIVDVFFEEMGLKRVAASLAKLEIKT